MPDAQSDGGKDADDGAADAGGYHDAGPGIGLADGSVDGGVSLEFMPPPALVDREPPLTGLALPSLEDAVDPRTPIEGQPSIGGALPSPTLMPGRIAVLAEPDQARFAACSHPVRPSTLPTLTPVIDGAIGEWAGVIPVVVDREGDGTALGDLLELRFAVDDDFYYFAVTLAQGLGEAALHLEFYSIDPSQLQAGIPTLGLDVGLWRYGNSDLLLGPASFTAPQPANAVAGPSGQGVASVEFRVPRASIASVFGTQPFSVSPTVRDSATLLQDAAGAHAVGPIEDYGCLVALPMGRSKLLVFHRGADIEAEQAEVVYRAMLAAAPAAELAIGELYEDVDTLVINVVTDLWMAGLQQSQGVINLRYEPPAGLFPGEDPLGYFHVAAHEYVHGVNASERIAALPVWAREGHSEWAASKAAWLAAGAPLEEWRIRTQMGFFARDEDELGNVPLDVSPWPVDNHPLGYHYQKSEAFYHLLEPLLPAAALQRAIFDPTAELPAAFATQPEFTGSLTADMWNGWFGGSYASGILPRNMLSTDTDADGLLDFEEPMRGLDPESADTDADGMTDLFELGADRDPTTADDDVASLMAADGRIDDWTRLVPELLTSSGITRRNDVRCADLPRVLRYGVLFDGDWLLVAVELDRKPPPGYGIAADVTTPDENRIDTIFTSQGETNIFGSGYTIPLVAPFVERAVELHYHRSWLGWGDDVPGNFTVSIYDWSGDGSTAVVCSVSNATAPSLAVP